MELTPIYDAYINERLNEGHSISEIKLLCCADANGAAECLEDLIDCWGWEEDTTLEEWANYVEDYRRENPIPIEVKSATVGHPLNEIDVRGILGNNRSSSYRLRDVFKSKGLNNASIRSIESSAGAILNRLSFDTRECGPIKGLVFGSVQSGKTANMEELVSLAADSEWNIFIILSGTIEGLRMQTMERFKADLTASPSISWRHIDLSGEDKDLPVSALSFNAPREKRTGERYVITCLKHKSRLTRLINWLYSDKDRARRMRVIVIDDEADQASINTAPILDDEDADEYEQERKEINRLIVCLANGLLADGSKPAVHLQAMNYVSYTATPYANVLNEGPGESLYPKDFVHSLDAPDEYFGVNVIFGNNEMVDESGNSLAPGLDIIRRVPDEDIALMKGAHKAGVGKVPSSLRDALQWFLCCVGVLRHRGYSKPISMLVHTSGRSVDHEVDYQLVESYLKMTPREEVLVGCKCIYDYETSRFNYQSFIENFSSYGLRDQMDKILPAFEDIADEISELLTSVGNIRIASDGGFSYSPGINLCIDNCYSDRDAPEGVKMRLEYPTKEQLCEMQKAPTFVVVGGNTLARGLTIEGLVCTFFTRNVRQADTLMQMARWFGYRRGSELLQRVWLSEEIDKKYRALSKVEMNLKLEIEQFEKQGLRPADLGVKVLAMPEIKKFTLSSKDKTQSAVSVDFDFRGRSYEVTEFDSDEEVLSRNIELTTEFLETLTSNGAPQQIGSAFIWKGVSTDLVISYLSNYGLSRHSSFSDSDIKELSCWLRGRALELFDSWNVAVAGKSNAPSGTWECGGVTGLPRVERSKKSSVLEWVDIGSLRSGSDAVCDVDRSSLNEAQKAILDAGSRNSDVGAKRSRLGLGRTPLLLIYRIDSASTGCRSGRLPIGTKSDIVSFSVILPGEKYGMGTTAYAIKLKKGWSCRY